MVIIFCAWVACLAIVFMMVKRAPLIEDDTADDELPDDRVKPSEFRARALSRP